MSKRPISSVEAAVAQVPDKRARIPVDPIPNAPVAPLKRERPATEKLSALLSVSNQEWMNMCTTRTDEIAADTDNRSRDITKTYNHIVEKTVKSTSIEIAQRVNILKSDVDKQLREYTATVNAHHVDAVAKYNACLERMTKQTGKGDLIASIKEQMSILSYEYHLAKVSSGRLRAEGAAKIKLIQHLSVQLQSLKMLKD